MEVCLCLGNVHGREVDNARIDSRGERWLSPRDQPDGDRGPDDRRRTGVGCGQPTGGVFVDFKGSVSPVSVVIIQ